MRKGGIILSRPFLYPRVKVTIYAKFSARKLIEHLQILHERRMSPTFTAKVNFVRL